MANTKYWFKRRRYGQGVVPASKEGWLLTLGYAGFVMATAFLFIYLAPPTAVFAYILCIFASGFVFIYIIQKHSPVMKWRWGKKPTDNPNEDW